MQLKKIAPLFPLLSGVLWGLTGIFVRKLNGIGMDNFQLTFFRSFFAAISLVAYFLLTDKDQLKVNPKDLWCFFGTGILSVFSFSVCYFYTLMHSSVSVAVILAYTAPFFVIILSAIIFREKITLLKLTALFVATLGCFLLCKTDKNTPITAVVILIGLLAGLSYASYSIFARFVVGKYPPLVITAYTFIFSSIASFFLADFKSLFSVISAHPESILTLIIFSFVSTLMPYLLLTIGLKYVEAGKAAILTTTEVLTASLVGILFFREKITAAGILGIILILAAVVSINIKLSGKNL
ncbi:MAG: EamA family transporter [Clostridia bacterium]|nr:EamA family transporter [Clostridia bacterium]MBQ7751608.1 EamA family transporter [Clostridia bacterium]